MKSLNKRKQNLSTAGELMITCVCRTHACSCTGYPGDTMYTTREDLYLAAINTADRREPTFGSEI